jgi:PhoPQ-activated pathogenicity-related protein
MARFPFRLSRLFAAFLLAMLCGCSHAALPSTQAAPPTALDEYIARDEPHYKWEKTGEEDSPQNKATILTLTSQTWQGHDWTHRIEIIRPQKNEFPDTALVLVSYGAPAESLAAQLLASQAGATVINVANVPNQPLFGKNEDALIAYTFQKFLETGDTTWPLLLPMTKAVVKAMDAAQEYSKQSLDVPITKFIVGGASKRGWTSWLVAAADARLHPGRVTGIIPLVYNNLNIPAQLPHQLESWGEYSPMIGDYTKLGLQNQTSTHGGKQLIEIVDPYSYRDRFTMPKLLINGTNDPYWTPDATRFYLPDLPGSTSLYWAPNAGHDLANDYPNVLGTTAAWFRLVAGERKIFTVDAWTIFNGRHVQCIVVRPSQKVKSVIIYVAYAATRDFRNSKWKSIPVKHGIGDKGTIDYIADIPATPTGSTSVAAIATATSATGVKISSPVMIWNSKPVKASPLAHE